jgi:SAM-dependent methyltransferase
MADNKVKADGEYNRELDEIVSRYALRKQGQDAQYLWTNPAVNLPELEKDFAMLQFFARAGMTDFSRLTLLEVGCGGGSNLLAFLRWGFDPANLVGNDLLPPRLTYARRRLPPEVRLIEGDASVLDCGQFDIVYQSTVFSSVLDANFQMKLAKHMWNMTRPGGAVLWYDFCYNNPRNPDVRGVPSRRIRQLFPESKMIMKRVTLAPPISRPVSRISSRLWSLLNGMPFLRTHALCWIPKPAQKALAA